MTFLCEIHVIYVMGYLDASCCGSRHDLDMFVLKMLLVRWLICASTPFRVVVAKRVKRVKCCLARWHPAKWKKTTNAFCRSFDFSPSGLHAHTSYMYVKCFLLDMTGKFDLGGDNAKRGRSERANVMSHGCPLYFDFFAFSLGQTIRFVAVWTGELAPFRKNSTTSGRGTNQPPHAREIF